VSSGLWEQPRPELIDGELLSKRGKKQPHVFLLKRILVWLLTWLDVEPVLQDAPIDVAPGDNLINEPEPDLIVFKRPQGKIRLANPQPDELALVVEVSDTSLRFDLTVKASLYARAGIMEYWVADVSGHRLIVHRDPSPAGYRSVVAYSDLEKVAPLTSPEHELPIGEIFA
jgi:Uma2 family endonuclease